MTQEARLFTELRALLPGEEEPRPLEILCRGGRIAALGLGLSAPGAERVSLGGAVVLPGAIDAHVHYDEPGYTFREDFEHGTASAAAGGVTTAVDMPCTSVPEVTRLENLRAKEEVVGPRARVDYAFWGGVLAGEVGPGGPWREHMAELVEAGVVGFKVYTLSGMETYPRLDPLRMLRVFRTARELDSLVAVHAEDAELVGALEAELRAAGRKGPLDYARSRPPLAEALAVAQAAEIAAEAGNRLHVVHLSSAAGLRALRRYRAAGLDLTAETCPHFLAFTEEDLARLGGLLKTAPVVKGAEDREALWAALRRGELAYVATDHAPCPWPEAKNTGSIWTDYGGVPGSELLLPYLLSEGLAAGRLSWRRLVEVVAEAPARRLGLAHRKGFLRVGADCDLAVVDPGLEWTVRGAELRSKGRFTPLEGRLLRGAVLRTVLRGRTVYERDRGLVGEPGWGERVEARRP